MMIQRVLNNLPIAGSQPTLILRREHMKALPQAVQVLASRGVGIVPVEALTEGTACTVLLAREHFDNDQPLLIANLRPIGRRRLGAFVADCLKRGLDGSILVFRDDTRNPKWSFAQTDPIGRAMGRGKGSDFQLGDGGDLLVRRGRDFVSAAADMIANNDRVNGEFYTCPVYNYMIRSGLNIGVYEIPQSAMHIGTPPTRRSSRADRLRRPVIVVVPLAGPDFEGDDGLVKSERQVQDFPCSGAPSRAGPGGATPSNS